MTPSAPQAAAQRDVAIHHKARVAAERAAAELQHRLVQERAEAAGRLLSVQEDLAQVSPRTQTFLP